MNRIGFSRMETDLELVIRIRAKDRSALQLPWESIDQFADRFGLARRIVEGEP